jgi:glutamate-1-semialdehyde 2,1-aminomutase
VYQAGTLSGNPIAMIAGYTTLKTLQENPAIYSELHDKTAYLRNGLDEVFKTSGQPYVINHFESMISVHFSSHPVTDFATAASANNQVFNKFFHAMLNRGIYLPPSAFESWFLNNPLSYHDLDVTITAAKESMKEITGD